MPSVVAYREWWLSLSEDDRARYYEPLELAEPCTGGLWLGTRKGRYKAVRRFCRRKNCSDPECQRSRVFASVLRLRRWRPPGGRFYFVTLTVPSPTWEEMDRDWFKRFRRAATDAIFRYVPTAVRATDVTIGRIPGRVHPHFHFIVPEADFSGLSSVWRECLESFGFCFDSPRLMVDVREVDGELDGAFRYLVSYFLGRLDKRLSGGVYEPHSDAALRKHAGGTATVLLKNLRSFELVFRDKESRGMYQDQELPSYVAEEVWHEPTGVERKYEVEHVPYYLNGRVVTSIGLRDVGGGVDPLVRVIGTKEYSDAIEIGMRGNDDDSLDDVSVVFRYTLGDDARDIAANEWRRLWFHGPFEVFAEDYAGGGGFVFLVDVLLPGVEYGVVEMFKSDGGVGVIDEGHSRDKESVV